jgi:hypothetical protein
MRYMQKISYSGGRTDSYGMVHTHLQLVAGRLQVQLLVPDGRGLQENKSRSQCKGFILHAHSIGPKTMISNSTSTATVHMSDT